MELESAFGNAKNVSEQPKDSRIVDEKLGLCEFCGAKSLAVGFG